MAVLWVLVSVAVVVVVVTVWRVIIHDRSIRRVRFGVFYERDRTDDDNERER